MKIFDYIIADKVIAGISEMHTDFNEGMSTKRYWFQLYTLTGTIIITSDTFDAGDSMALQREAWLQRFDAIKESIGRLLEGPKPAQVTLVNDAYTSLVEHINEALKLLEPRNKADGEKVQAHKDRIFLNARKLKDLVAA